MLHACSDVTTANTRTINLYENGGKLDLEYKSIDLEYQSMDLEYQSIDLECQQNKSSTASTCAAV